MYDTVNKIFEKKTESIVNERKTFINLLYLQLRITIANVMHSGHRRESRRGEAGRESGEAQAAARLSSFPPSRRAPAAMLDTVGRVMARALPSTRSYTHNFKN